MNATSRLISFLIRLRLDFPCDLFRPSIIFSIVFPTSVVKGFKCLPHTTEVARIYHLTIGQAIFLEFDIHCSK